MYLMHSHIFKVYGECLYFSLDGYVAFLKWWNLIFSCFQKSLVTLYFKVQFSLLANN